MKDYLIFIPVKAHSERVENKNLREFAQTSLLEIAIKKALEFSPAEKIYLNTNCEDATNLALAYNIKVYKRDEALCSNETTLDTIIFDFIKSKPCKKVIMLNTITPLLEVKYLAQMFDYFKTNKLNSLIAGNKFKLHAFCENKSINFKNEGAIPQTQNIPSVDVCNWGYGIWDTKVFTQNYESQNANGIFSGDFEIFDTNIFQSIKISEEADFLLAEKEYLKNR